MGPGSFIGVSTHTDDQVRIADPTSRLRTRGRVDPWQGTDPGAVDYIAVGPVFATASKLNPEPVIGLEGVRRARALTRKPIVAIGGMTRENARSVIEAGADSIAVIGAFFTPNETPAKVARDFLDILR
jgi:thiamine-phosphate pyrophosphorylase